MGRPDSAMKLFQREQRSLFGEILDWMLTPLLLLWPVSLGLTWFVAQGVAGKPFDRALEYNVVALAQLVTVNQHKVVFNLPQPARELLRADEESTVFYQVLGARGEYLSGDKDLPLPSEDETPEINEVRLREDMVRGIDVKVAYTWVKVPLPDAKLVLVQVAETLEKRSVLATEITKGVMLPQFVILPLAVLLVWMALVQALKPLTRLENLIRARRPDDMSPLDTQSVPKEGTSQACAAHMRPTFSMMKDMPIAEIRGARRGALRRRLYASRSIVALRTAQTTIAITKARIRPNTIFPGSLLSRVPVTERTVREVNTPTI